MARHALRSLEVYSTLNKDLVLAGAILHDLGKIKELTNPECPQRSVPGGLVGHIVLGWEMMREEARIIDFPDNHLLMELEHIIIAHHGSEEFGSPVLPKTPEAFLVYYLDEIDAKLHMAQRHLERDSSEGDFTIKHPNQRRKNSNPCGSQANLSFFAPGKKTSDQAFRRPQVAPWHRGRPGTSRLAVQATPKS
jgi:3'-5' exoribonuclease